MPFTRAERNQSMQTRYNCAECKLWEERTALTSPLALALYQRKTPLAHDLRRGRCPACYKQLKNGYSS